MATVAEIKARAEANRGNAEAVRQRAIAEGNVNPNYQSIKERAQAMPKASDEVMAIRNAGSTPSPIGDAYKSLAPEQKRQYMQSDAAGQDSFAKGLAPNTIGPQPTAVSSTQAQPQAQGNWWDKINTDAIEAVKAQIAQQTQELQNQLANNKQLTQQQVDAMNAQLAENVQQMQRMNNVNDFRIAENENRFGGTYSGGLRLQQAANDRSTNEAIGAATRDTQTRSANLWSQYGQLASQAYDKISSLSQQTPELVQQYITRALQNASAFGGLTGQLPGGGQTFAAQQADRGFNLQEGQLTGNYNGQRTVAGQQLDSSNYWNQVGQGNWQQSFDYNKDRDARKDYESDRLFEYQSYRDNVNDTKWAQEFEQSVKARAEDMGYKWASLNQREKELLANEQAREYDRAVQAMDTDFNRGLEVYQATGEMPSYMSDYGVNVQALNSGQGEIKAEVEGLYSDLVSGNVTPEQALKMLDDAEKLKLKDSQTINELKKTVYMIAPETDPKVQEQKKKEQKQRQETRNEGIKEIVTPGGPWNPMDLYKERVNQLKKIFGG